MILPGLGGVQASLDMTFGDVAVNYNSIVEVMLETDENLHDYACVTMRGIPTRAVTDYLDANVELTLSTGAKFKHEFLGTVEKVEPVSIARDGTVNGSPFQTAKLHCFGASYRMRGKRTHVWENISLEHMATVLGKRYGLSVSTIKPKRSIPRYVQESESDWEALVNYAGRYGFKVNVTGTHLHVYDPLKALSRNRSLHKLHTVQSSGMVSAPGKITTFHAELSRKAVDGTFKDANVTVMTDSGVLFDVTSADVFSKPKGKAVLPHQMSQAVDSYGEAKAVIQAEARREYDYIGHVECMGLAGAAPGGVVDLGKYRSGIDGLWYVSSVKHTVYSGHFSSNLEIKKFADRPLELTSTQQYRRPPESVIRNGRWESSKDLIDCYV